MNFYGFVTHILSFLPISLQAAIAVVIFKRRLIKTFPLFFAYTIAVLSLDMGLLLLPYPSNVYAWVYWSGEVIAISLGLAAIVQTFRQLLPPFPFLRFARKGFLLLSVAAVIAACLLLIFAQVESNRDRLFAMILLGERSVKFVEVCWLILVIVFVTHLGRGWHQYSVGIVAGFGIYSALTLGLFELRAHLNLLSDPAFVMLNSAAYDIASIIWAFYFLRPDRSSPLERLPETDLQDWNNAVTQYYAPQWYRRY